MNAHKRSTSSAVLSGESSLCLKGGLRISICSNLCLTVGTGSCSTISSSHIRISLLDSTVHKDMVTINTFVLFSILFQVYSDTVKWCRSGGIYPLQYLTRGMAYVIIPSQYCEKLSIFCLTFTNIQTKSTDFALKTADF